MLGRYGKGKTGTLLAGDDNMGSYNNGSYNNGTGNLVSDLGTLAVCCVFLKQSSQHCVLAVVDWITAAKA